MTPTINLSNVAVPDGLVGYWFAGVHGTPPLGTVRDLSENGNDATCVGNAFINDEGGQFDGSTAYINCGGDSAIVGIVPFAVSAWIKTSASTRQMVAIQRSTTNPDGQFSFEVNTSGKVVFAVYNGGNGFSFASNKTVNDGDWHNVCLARINSTDAVMFIDGIEDNTGTGTAKSLLPVVMYIGRFTSEALFYFDGIISDFRLYNGLLTEDKFRQIYDSTKWRHQNA